MKYIGIIKGHHLDDSGEVDLSFRKLSKSNVNRVLEYIDRYGERFAVTMNVVESFATNEMLGSVSFYTDGSWIWPSYFAHYLEHGLIDISKDFLHHIESVDDEKETYLCTSISNAINYHKENFGTYLNTDNS